MEGNGNVGNVEDCEKFGGGGGGRTIRLGQGVEDVLKVYGGLSQD